MLNNTTSEPQIETFLGLLKHLQEIDPEFPLQYSICLAEISRSEGLSLTQLSKKTGLPLSTISRIVGALSDYRKNNQPYGLIKQEISKEERRRKELYLTPKGKAIMAKIVNQISIK